MTNYSQERIMKQKLPLTTAAAASLFLAVSLSGCQSEDNSKTPFEAKEVVKSAAPADTNAAEGKCGGDKAKAMAEGKCGGDKAKAMTEGKCGGDKAKAMTEGKCGGDKAKGKAEGKCGKGKCGANKK